MHSNLSSDDTISRIAEAIAIQLVAARDAGHVTEQRHVVKITGLVEGDASSHIDFVRVLAEPTGSLAVC